MRTFNVVLTLLLIFYIARGFCGVVLPNGLRARLCRPVFQRSHNMYSCEVDDEGKREAKTGAAEKVGLYSGWRL